MAKNLSKIIGCVFKKKNYSFCFLIVGDNVDTVELWPCLIMLASLCQNIFVAMVTGW